MKIFGPGETGKVGLDHIRKKDGVKKGQDFAKVLADEKGKVQGIKNEKISQTKQAAIPQFPSHQALTSVEAVGRTGEGTDLMKAIKLTEQVIGRLDFFKAALENQKVDITKFSPLIEALKNDGKNLEEISTNLSSHPQLKTLADETSTLAAKEVLKFYRGDYG